MKARLLQQDDVLMLLLCTGRVKRLSDSEAYNFITNFDDPSYYSDPGKWEYEEVTMEDFPGEAIAVVNDEGVLCVVNSERFRWLLDKKSHGYLTVTEYAEQHDKQVAIIRRFCSEGRLPGAFQKGKTWLIPEGCPYPADERIRK